jgi:hypothetical protein
MDKLRFRQVHLDFHTSEHIPGIGLKFDKKQWQDQLQTARVNSITCFSLCHHGWSYHPTKVGTRHPHLNFDLLRAQIDASHEIGVNVPVYLTAGVNNVASALNPAWREINFEGKYAGWTTNPLTAGFHKLCFNTPYLDYLCRLIEEAVTLFPDGNGIFLDIISQGQCCCPACMKDMLSAGFNPENSADREAFAEQTLLKYYRRTTEAARLHDDKMAVFHNSGHVQCGKTDILQYFSHLELESLPTGGWGYDHYPLSAAYARKLDLDFLGMTGKFHTTWGEFGGLKHPNALRYECAAMLANGSKCSIGDQLHPNGKLDNSTYQIIGEAYREVEAKEPWCDDVTSAAVVAILSSTAVNNRSGRGDGESLSEIGASRLLLEGHIHFDMIDQSMDFSAYQVLVLPDDIPVNTELQTKLEAFISNGGRLIMSGASGLKPDGKGFAFDIGAEYHGVSPFQPDYVLPSSDITPDYVKTPVVMYLPSQRIKAVKSRSLGQIFDPYFNRTYQHFCSHQHAPFQEQPSGFDAGVATDRILYFAHPVFTIYRAYGAVVYKEFILNAIVKFLGDDIQLRTNLPSQGRVTLMEQPSQHRYVLHLLYVNTILRGGSIDHYSSPYIRPASPIEVVEELNPVSGVKVELKISKPIKKVTLEPQGRELPFEMLSNGRVAIDVGTFTCHQMVVLHY